MTQPFYPSLNEKGWTSHPPEVLDGVLSSYVNSEHNQSDITYGNVQSLPYDIANFNQSPANLERQVSNSVRTLLQQWFPEGSEVTITVAPLDKKEPNKMDIQMKAAVTVAGVVYDVGKLISVIDGRVNNYMSLQGD